MPLVIGFDVGNRAQRFAGFALQADIPRASVLQTHAHRPVGIFGHTIAKAHQIGFGRIPRRVARDHAHAAFVAQRGNFQDLIAAFIAIERRDFDIGVLVIGVICGDFSDDWSHSSASASIGSFAGLGFFPDRRATLKIAPLHRREVGSDQVQNRRGFVLCAVENPVACRGREFQSGVIARAEFPLHARAIGQRGQVARAGNAPGQSVVAVIVVERGVF